MRPVVMKSIQIQQHWPQAVCFGQTGVGGPEIWSFGREDGIMLAGNYFQYRRDTYDTFSQTRIERGRQGLEVQDDRGRDVSVSLRTI